jgi:predicted unusual protein kinase regulating ubiquinone biosynthesis (AarF/ABC1/UbiB family)
VQMQYRLAYVRYFLSAAIRLVLPFSKYCVRILWLYSKWVYLALSSFIVSFSSTQRVVSGTINTATSNNEQLLQTKQFDEQCDVLKGELLYEVAVIAGTVTRKALQTLATRSDLFSPTVTQQLRRICHSVEEMSDSELQTILNEAYPAASQFPFDTFDRVPLASGCIAQVHRATLRKSRVQSKRKQFAALEDESYHQNLTNTSSQQDSILTTESAGHAAERDKSSSTSSKSNNGSSNTDPATKDASDIIAVAVKVYRKNIFSYIEYDFDLLLFATDIVQFFLRARFWLAIGWYLSLQFVFNVYHKCCECCCDFLYYFCPCLLVITITSSPLQAQKKGHDSNSITTDTTTAQKRRYDQHLWQYRQHLRQSYGRQRDVREIVRKLRQEFLLQADPKQEMHNLQEFSRVYSQEQGAHLTWPLLYSKVCRAKHGIIVMEFLEGFTLQDRAQLAKCTDEQRQLIYNELLQMGISGLFLRELYHSDLHAGNIMFCPGRNQVGIIDFGMLSYKSRVQAGDLMEMYMTLSEKRWSDSPPAMFQVVTKVPLTVDEFPAQCSSPLLLACLWLELYHGLRDYCLNSFTRSMRYSIEMCNTLERYGFELDSEVSGINLSLMTLEATLQIVRPQVQLLGTVLKHLGFEIKKGENDCSEEMLNKTISIKRSAQPKKQHLLLEFLHQDSNKTVLSQLMHASDGSAIEQQDIDNPRLSPPMALNEQFVTDVYNKAVAYWEAHSSATQTESEQEL